MVFSCYVQQMSLFGKESCCVSTNIMYISYFLFKGISGKSQILFALVFTTRYLDLLTSFISLYNSSMKVGSCTRLWTEVKDGDHLSCVYWLLLFSRWSTLAVPTPQYTWFIWNSEPPTTVTTTASEWSSWSFQLAAWLFLSTMTFLL